MERNIWAQRVVFLFSLLWNDKEMKDENQYHCIKSHKRYYSVVLRLQSMLSLWQEMELMVYSDNQTTANSFLQCLRHYCQQNINGKCQGLIYFCLALFTRLFCKIDEPLSTPPQKTQTQFGQLGSSIGFMWVTLWPREGYAGHKY